MFTNIFNQAACKDPNFSAKYRKRCKGKGKGKGKGRAPKCPAPKRCGLIRDPVCDSNGKKYPNPCELRKVSFTLSFK